MKIKLRNQFITGVLLLGSITTVAQAASVTIGTLTATTPGNVGTLSAGTSYALGDTGVLNVNTNLVNSSTTATKTFYDDFVFTIAPGSTLNSSFLASLQLPSFLGITGFTESLYTGSVTSFSTTTTDPLAAFSPIATTTTNTLSATNLAAGTYTLQFSGTLGKAGSLLGTTVPATGTYASLVSISPVPEEDTYAMMLAGLSLIGFKARRKNQQPA